MLTWNKENLWNYHVSLVRERDSRLWSAVISQYHFAHILVTRHWVAYHISSFNIENCGSSTMHISTAAHCTCPLSYIAGDTDQCFLLSTVVFGSIGNFPKHRWQKTALRFHVDRKTLLFFSLQTYLIFVRNARNAVSVKFQKNEKITVLGKYVVNLCTFRV